MTTSDSADEASRHLADGEACSSAGNNEEAVRHFRAALALAAQPCWVHVRLGNHLLELDRRDEAEATFVRALESFPRAPAAPKAALGAAKISMANSRWQEALTRIELGLACQPQQRRLLELKAEALGQLGAFDDADALLRQLTEQDPRQPAAWVRRAWLAMRRERWDQAVECWDACLERFPDQENSRVWEKARARSLFKSGAYDQAEAAYVRVAAESPEDQPAFERLALISHRNERWDAALTRWSDCLDRFPDSANPSWHACKATALRELGDDREARRVFSRLVGRHWTLATSASAPRTPPNAEPFTLAILTCVWKRPQLTDIVLDYYARLRQSWSDDIRLQLVAVGSEGARSRAVCEKHGVDYHEFANSPLSDKWNHGLLQARQGNPDAVLIVGSDDLVAAGTIRFLVSKIQAGYAVAGISDAYFYDLESRALHYWKGYADGNDMCRLHETIGMARCLSSAVLERLDYDVWSKSQIDRGLDRAATHRLQEIGVAPCPEDWAIAVDSGVDRLLIGHVAYPLAVTGGIAVDIKTTTNLTTLDRMLEHDSDSLCDVHDAAGELRRHFDDEVIAALLRAGKPSVSVPGRPEGTGETHDDEALSIRDSYRGGPRAGRGGPEILRMMAVYNESDVLQQNIDWYHRAGIPTVVVDNGSTDGSYELLEAALSDGKITALERIETAEFVWRKMLSSLQVLADKFDPQWLMLTAPDEFFEPADGSDLLAALREDIAAGYNLIKFFNMEFWMTERDDPAIQDVLRRIRHYSCYDVVMYRAYPNVPGIDILSKSGHRPKFPSMTDKPSPRLYVSRHYKLRSVEQAARKISRIRPTSSEPNAHRHYVRFSGDPSEFVVPSATLHRYDFDHRWNFESTFDGRRGRQRETRLPAAEERK